MVSVQSMLHETFWPLICLSPLSYFLVQNFCKAGYYLRIPEKTPTKIILAMNQYYLYEHSFSEIFVGVEEEVRASLRKIELESISTTGFYTKVIRMHPP